MPHTSSRFSFPFLAGWSLAALLSLAGCASNVPLSPAQPSTTPPPAPAAAAPAAAATPAAADHWAGMQALVGRYPTDGVDFLRTGPMAERLKGLLGPVNYPVLLQNMGTSGPLRKEGNLLYITGNRPHQGGSESAAVVLDPARDAMRVWLQTDGEEWDVQDYGRGVQMPAEVRTMMENARR
ncbi:hypothetical protein [Paracidovorax oryzae]|uniref:hypothetical protein n=2 Tax=Paracidovorax TaxID=3051137 RepID=UPI00049578BA|nr:hypothetical protein [Paracidovorax oryzae]